MLVKGPQNTMVLYKAFKKKSQKQGVLNLPPPDVRSSKSAEMCCCWCFQELGWHKHLFMFSISIFFRATDKFWLLIVKFVSSFTREEGVLGFLVCFLGILNISHLLWDAVLFASCVHYS